MRIKRSPFKPRAKAGLYKIKDADPTYDCECIDCGHEMQSDEHCRDIQCPECGGEMRRAERPGQGAKSAKATEATVFIYDEIGRFGVNAGDFIKDLNGIKAKTIHLRFNSPGGSVFDGTAVFNAIKQHKAKTVSHIDGLAASISSVIALASDEVRMAENAFLMIHDPWSMVIGNADIMREEADLLDKIGGTIAKSYMDKTGKDAKEIKKLMAAETWMTADEALEMGFIDAIDENEEDEKAKATLFDLSVFANVPDTLMKMEAKKDLNERDLEKVLREAGGCSRSQAKEILAKGFAAIQDVRDAQTESDGQDVRDAQTEETPLRDAEPAEDHAITEGSTEYLLMQAEIMAPTG